MIIGLGLTLRSTLFGSAFSPTALFAADEQGAWFDHSDLSTLFQDAAGTMPVTTPGQTVALKLDKSQGLVLGPELVTNGGFDSDTGWNKGTGWTISGGKASLPPSATTALFQQVAVITNSFYELSFGLVRVQGIMSVRLGDDSGGSQVAALSSSGTYRFLAKKIGTGSNLIFRGVSATNEFTLDNISLRLLPGNHAVQSTALQRPTFGVEYNGTGPLGDELVTNGTFDTDTNWTKGAGWTISGGATSFSSGSGSDLTQTGLTFAANTTYRLSFDMTQVSGGGFRFIVDQDGSFITSYFNTTAPHTFVFSVGATSTRLRLGALGGSSFSVDNISVRELPAVSWRGYLQTDGVDDGMVTPTITPGTDKAQVFAGVRKLSDASGSLVELSTNGTSNNGSFVLQASDVGRYGVGSRGTIAVNLLNGVGATTPPITNVLTGLGDISGDRTTLRIDGVQVAQSTADQGTGNYLAYPVYLYRRGGTSLPFNGRSYQEVLRFGPSLTDAQIAAMESFIAGKTGVEL